MGGIIEDVIRATPVINQFVEIAEETPQVTDAAREIPVVGDIVDTLVPPQGDAEIASTTLTTALTPEPEQRIAPTEIPLPEEPVKKRRRAAKAKQGRRGRASTILTALNNEPLGGG